MTSVEQIPVGDLHCQRDTYCREFTTRCVDCSEKPNKKGLYEVKLHDTILFPEGGGQPSDTGFIDDVPVVDVQRRQLQHVHFTKQPIQVSKEVTVKLDWQRRWDHVQQHSGQHLLSAVLEQEPYNLETVGWNLGEKRSYVELGTAKGGQKPPSQEILDQVERRVNDLILQEIPVIRHVQVNADDGERPDSLPADYIGGGLIRTIEIQDFDKNPCCGTHVRHLGHLQCLKILNTEKVRGGNTRVFFLFGQRVLDTLNANYKVERQLTSLLSCPLESFVDSVTKIQQQSRQHMKQAKRLLADLAEHTVTELETTLATQPFAVSYRDDADMEYVSMIATLLKNKKTLDGQDKVVILAAGEKQVGGPIIVVGGNDDVVQKASKTVTQTIEGVKGGGKGRWQGKAKSWQGIEKLEEALNALFI
ncbi:Threonyl/alanyl tRNA synthetase [Radiomyces spectabilis]|uniref:Threonyl/alanyl tRNA synthetase n=1 Tax=Radiomyces spectabilis TaxID=64574 RepID=UPI00221F5367|nr:Threonyl/alanyl tRNA synthetase [Radiomyces spectabilis]KAI8371688.1 Threonyl/alanyl tRNA synthetase [Radiomyces spectabilis]